MSERKLLENQLLLERDKAQNYLDIAGVMIVAINTQGNITMINKKGSEFLGFPAEEIVGKNWFDKFLPVGMRNETKAYALRLLKGEAKPVDYHEKNILNADGKERLFAWQNSLIKDSAGKIIGHLSSGEDITDRRRNEEELEKYREHLEVLVEERTKELMDAQEHLMLSERLAALGEYSGNISHELRNPLGVIGSSVYYLKIKLKDADAKTRQHLDRIKTSVDSSTAIIESLLNLTRMQEPHLVRLSLIFATDNAVITSRVPSTAKVIKDFPEKDVWVNADQDQPRMAFKNVINNAVDAMGGKGTLTLTVRRITRGLAEASFADTGPGIESKNLDKVFQPLFSTKAKGIGFGLSIARMIIEKHGGTIAAKSKPGKGATIIIKLPLYVDKEKGAISKPD